VSDVNCEIVVHAPVDAVYRAWRNFAGFPAFMRNIEEVRDIGYGHSRWKAKGPLGYEAEWEAELITDEPCRAVAWRSIDGPAGNVRTRGAVRFEDHGGDTRLCVTMSYDPPAGALGDLAARIFADPERQVEDDLRRFKDMIESGSPEHPSPGRR